MPLLDHFGILAPFYERVIRFNDAGRLVKLAGLPVDGILLDAGGGTGRVAEALKGQAGSIVVADESMGMLRQAHAKQALNPTRAHTERLPYADATFECVLMIDALHHLASQQESAAELFRVIKPGGRVVIQEPDVRTAAVKVVALLEKVALMRSHFLAPEAIAALFDFPQAHTTITREGFNAWVIVEKRV